MHKTRGLIVLLAASLLHCTGTAAGSRDAGATRIDAGTDAGATDAGPGTPPDAGHPYPPYDGGPIVIADFIAQMDPDSWREIPGSQMEAVCPDVDHYQCEAVIIAWGGGAWDSLHDRLLIFGGGHSDSYVNTVFAFDLGPAKWVRLSELPGPLQGGALPEVYRDIRLETCGLYPAVQTLSIPAGWLTPSGYVTREKCEDPSITAQMDPQQPRSTHTYGGLAFSAATASFYLLGSSALFPSGQATSTRTMAFDVEARQWSRKADNVHVMIGAASATDARGHLYYLATGSAAEYDPLADTWAELPGGSNTGSYYAGAAVDTRRNRLALTSDGVNLQTWQLGDGGLREASLTTGLAAAIPSQLAFEYDPALDRYFAWAGGRTVHWLDPETRTWTDSTGGGDDPGGMPVNGVYGKLRYSATYGVYVLVRAANSNVVLYRPPATAP